MNNTLFQAEERSSYTADVSTNDGIIAVDKPEGLSSSALVFRIKKALGVKKAGHTGTLDPFATGLMLCGINKGTRLSRFLLGGDKRYTAEIALGAKTDTFDRTGRITYSCTTDRSIDYIDDSLIKSVVGQFIGNQMQTPPVYSALKHNGKPLYKLAREGNPVTKPPREITIYSIDLVNIERYNASASEISTYITLDIHSSSGTYIRSLANDIGDKIGCGGYLHSLRRTECCGFSINQAIRLSEIEAMDQKEASGRVIPMRNAIHRMQEIRADDVLMNKIRFGKPIDCSDIKLPITDIRESADKYLYSPDPDGNNCRDKTSEESSAIYSKVLDKNGVLAAIIKYDKIVCQYDYCCVFAN